MLEHDAVILDRHYRPCFSYGPRRVVDNNVESCKPEEAQFWGVYIHTKHDIQATHVADAADKRSASLLVSTLWYNDGTRSALTNLLNQLQAVGIYIPGQESGQWGGTEGLSFTEAEAFSTQRATFTEVKASALIPQPQPVANPTITVPLSTLRHWRTLVDDNPQDLAPRMDAYLQHK